MKCLIFSDSHGDTAYLKRAILRNKDAEVIFFLGDGLMDIDEIAGREFSGALFKVKGNCDYGYSAYDASVKKTDEIVLLDKRIVFTHGDLYNAKSTTQDLSSLAVTREADIVLFGHTHNPAEIYVSTESEEYKLVKAHLVSKGILSQAQEEKPFYLFNPGSISYRSGIPTFGILTIEENKPPLFSHGTVSLHV